MKSGRKLTFEDGCSIVPGFYKMKLTPNGSGDPPHPQVPAATQGSEHHSTHLPALEHLFVTETFDCRGL